ncbi:MAG: zf-HC2 domain-containing protein [Phycisphaerae bacterium]|nr:zf-HC2 domain-containing protein [Phycisphaerae bacterium]
MQCATAHKLLSLRIDGELDDRRAPDLAAHLRDCPSCQAFARELERCAAALDAVSVSEPSADFGARVMASLPPQQSTSERWTLVRGLLRPLPMAAAVVALALGITLASLMNGNTTTTPTAEAFESDVYAESFSALPEDSSGARYIALVTDGGN